MTSTWTSRRQLPSGRLRLVAYSPYLETKWNHKWEEKTPNDLKVTVEQIVDRMERAVPTITAEIKEAERQREIRHKEWEEQKRRWDEAERVRNREETKKRRLDELASIFGDWQRQHRFDAFFLEVAQRAEQLGEADKSLMLDKVAEARRLLEGPDAFDRLRAWIPPEQ